MAGHLGTLVPGETPARSFRQRAEGCDEGVTQLAGRVSLGQRDQAEIPGSSVDERGDGGLAASAHDEVALPVAETLTQLDDRWPPVDEDGGRNESGHALIRSAALLSQRPAGAEFPGQGPTQAALGSLVERSVDGLVTEMPLGTIRPAGPEMGGDLLRAPLQVQLGLHLGSELGIRGQLGASGTSGPLAAAVMGQVGVVSAVVVRAAVAAQLPADRRRCPPEQAGYLPDRQAAATQRGNPPTLQQRQVPARTRGLGEIVRLQATVLRPPPVARLAPDPKAPACLNAADPGRQKAPVLGLELQPALTSPPRHQHSAMIKECCDKR